MATSTFWWWTSAPSSGWCDRDIMMVCIQRGWTRSCSSTEATVSGWMGAPRTWPGHGPSRRSAAPPVAAPGPDALTARHHHLMMIDRVVFFITLNPISAPCNLSNDGSLFAIAEFKGFFIRTQRRSLRDKIKRSMASLSFAYTLLIWKSHFKCEVQIKRNLEGSQLAKVG